MIIPSILFSAMNSHRIKTAITENGKLSLQNLPFKLWLKKATNYPNVRVLDLTIPIEIEV